MSGPSRITGLRRGHRQPSLLGQPRSSSSNAAVWVRSRGAAPAYGDEEKRFAYAIKDRPVSAKLCRCQSSGLKKPSCHRQNHVVVKGTVPVVANGGSGTQPG